MEEEEEEEVAAVSLSAGLYGWIGVLAVMKGVPSIGLPISGQSAQHGGDCMAHSEQDGRTEQR